MSCDDAQDATYCSERVAGLMSCNPQGATWCSEEVAGLIFEDAT